MKRFDVLTIGLQVIDLMIPGMDGHILDREMTLLDHAELTLGGDALNQAIVLSQLGAQTALMGAAGVDRLGDVLLQQLSRYPLSVFDRRIDVPTAICVVLIDEAHERHFLFQSGQNLALRYEDLDEAVIRDSAFVSVGGAMALPELTGETGSPEKMAQALHNGRGQLRDQARRTGLLCLCRRDRGTHSRVPLPLRRYDRRGRYVRRLVPVCKVTGLGYAGERQIRLRGRVCRCRACRRQHCHPQQGSGPGSDERTIKLQTTCLKAQAGGFLLYYRMDMNHSTVLGS